VVQTVPAIPRNIPAMVLADEAEIGVSLHHPEAETVTTLFDSSHIRAWGRRSRTKPEWRKGASRPLVSYELGSSDWTRMQRLFPRADLVPQRVSGK
jgi:hypothetical protein